MIKKVCKIITGIFIILIVIGILGSCLFKDDSPTNTTSISVVEEESVVPQEYTNALEKAKIYSDFMHMSKSKIYEQLTSEYGENFPSDAAQYAIDNLKADYNANALAKAKDYYEQMHMSKQGVYDQLVSEYGEAFTSEEAQYAIDNL